MTRFLLSCLLFLSLAACQKPTPKLPPPPDTPAYESEIRPLLTQHCLPCHSPATPREGAWKLSLLTPQIPVDFNLSLHPAFPFPETHRSLFQRWLETGQATETPWYHLPPKAQALPLPELLARPSDDPSIDPSIDSSIAPSGKVAPASASVLTPVPELTPESAPLLLAGDLLGVPGHTTHLRDAPDTPEHRLSSTLAQTHGLAADCASCHDHPYLPFTSTDYRRLLTVFSTSYDDRPSHPLKPPTRLRFQAASPELPDLIESLQLRRQDAQTAYQSWLADPQRLPTIPDLAHHLDFNKKGNTEGLFQRALLLQNQTPVSLPPIMKAALLNARGLTLSFRLQTPLQDATLLSLGQPGSGLTLSLVQGHPRLTLTRYWPGQALALRSLQAIPDREWTHLALSYDATRRADAVRLTINGRPAPLVIELDTLRAPLFIQGDQQIKVGGKADSPWKLDELSIFTRALSPPEMTHLYDDTHLFRITPDLDYFLQALDPPYRALTARFQDLSVPRFIEEPVMNQIPIGEMPHRNAHAEALASRNRLEFATALSERDRYLFARVTIDRLWRSQFNTALVPAGFHPAAPLPTHLDLLDHLTFQLLSTDWNIPRLKLLLQNLPQDRGIRTGATPERPFCPRPRLMKPRRRPTG